MSDGSAAKLFIIEQSIKCQPLCFWDELCVDNCFTFYSCDMIYAMQKTTEDQTARPLRSSLFLSLIQSQFASYVGVCVWCAADFSENNVL